MVSVCSLMSALGSSSLDPPELHAVSAIAATAAAAESCTNPERRIRSSFGLGLLDSSVEHQFV